MKLIKDLSIFAIKSMKQLNDICFQWLSIGVKALIFGPKVATKLCKIGQTFSH